MRKNEKKNVTTIEIPEGNRVYNFNGVFYLVQSRFGKDSEHNIQSRFGRMIENISPAHLTEENDDYKINA